MNPVAPVNNAMFPFSSEHDESFEVLDDFPSSALSREELSLVDANCKQGIMSNIPPDSMVSSVAFSVLSSGVLALLIFFDIVVSSFEQRAHRNS
jgi:hypothetical protein